MFTQVLRPPAPHAAPQHQACPCSSSPAAAAAVPRRRHHAAGTHTTRQRPSWQRHAPRASSSEDAVPTQRAATPDPEAVLEQLNGLRRQLEAAVAQEDYTAAKQLKEQADALRQQLSPVQQYVQHQLEKLQSGSTADKADAIKSLGEVGGEECLPGLAACLSDPDLADPASAAMWGVFSRHPDGEVALLMQQGVSFMELNQLPLALEAFEAAARLAPSFAEAHNKRATVLYLQKDYRESIAVCELVLDLNPFHFGAACGLGFCHMGLQDYPAALAAFERALSIHPGLGHIRRFVTALKQNSPEGGR